MAKDSGAAVVAIAQNLQVQVQSARQRAGHHQKVALIGPPKHGKTTAALTASKYAPETWPAPTLTNLSDGLLIMIDVGGHDTVLNLNVDIPLIDLGECQESGVLLERFKQAIAIARQRVESGETTFVVLDSFSEFTERVCRALVSANAGAPQKELSSRIWTPLSTKMGGVFADLASLPCDVIIISHVKDKGEDEDGKRFASQMAGNARIEMDVTGKSVQVLRRNTSAVIPVLRTQIGKNQFKYAFYPNGTMGIEGGTRYKLNDEEPANMRKLFEKIRSQQPTG
jgi:hypothetical protein